VGGGRDDGVLRGHGRLVRPDRVAGLGGPVSGLSRGLFQCPGCGGPSGGPGQCRACLEASPARPLIQWPPAPVSFTVPITQASQVNIAAAFGYIQAVYARAAGQWGEALGGFTRAMEAAGWPAAGARSGRGDPTGDPPLALRPTAPAEGRPEP
jgi:hypothetical protein